eukprot:1520024-Amphidinium_carterae.1
MPRKDSKLGNVGSSPCQHYGPKPCAAQALTSVHGWHLGTLAPRWIPLQQRPPSASSKASRWHAHPTGCELTR